MNEKQYRDDSGRALSGLLANPKIVSSLDEFDGDAGKDFQFRLVKLAAWMARKLQSQCDYNLKPREEK